MSYRILLVALLGLTLGACAPYAWRSTYYRSDYYVTDRYVSPGYAPGYYRYGRYPVAPQPRYYYQPVPRYHAPPGYRPLPPPDVRRWHGNPRYDYGHRQRWDYRRDRDRHDYRNDGPRYQDGGRHQGGWGDRRGRGH